MGKACIIFGGAALSLFIGYTAVEATTEGSPWYLNVLWVGFVVAGALFFLTGLAYLIPIVRRRLNIFTKRGQTVNETKTLDWVTCDKCGFIGVRNIKTRELEEMEDNQRRTGQPILTRINSLGDTEPRHEKIPECIMQEEDFATLPPLSSQPLPLFYMQLPRQCPQFIKWQKGLSPKEHKEGSAIPDMLKSPRPPEFQISYQKHEFGMDNGVPIITVWAEYRPTGPMRVEVIELHLVGKRIPSLDWKVLQMSQDLWYTSDNKFKLLARVSPGEHDAKLAAFANGEWWGSDPFTITFLEASLDMGGSQL